ncbi:MAG: hypothetical protein ACLFV7_04210 [Phycisphaerae bacterium]
MHLRELQFSGYFENQDAETAERLQIVVPEDDLEAELLAWTLLSHPRTVEGDPSRQGYVFQYELGEQLDRGVFALKVSGRDASGMEHAAEIAAALVVRGPVNEETFRTFAPHWLLSESVNFRPLQGMSEEQYHGAAFGHLRFEGSGYLPHRRLIGATV